MASKSVRKAKRKFIQSVKEGLTSADVNYMSEQNPVAFRTAVNQLARKKPDGKGN